MDELKEVFRGISDEEIEKNKQRFLSIVESFTEHKFDKDKVVNYLCNSDFFVAPASTKYHCNFKGGLCLHSLTVYDTLVKYIKMAYPDILVYSALTDAEQHLRLVYGFRKRIQPIHFGFAAVKPTDGSVHGMRNIAFIRNGGGAFVKSHGNCGCERGLYLHTHLRAHKDLCTVHMRGKSHAFFLDIAQLCKRKYLKSAAVGKHGAIPIEKLMYPAELVNDILARADMKMICVGKLHLAADPFQIAGGYGALYRGTCADIHKHRRENIAVNGAENACARTAAGMVYLEAHFCHLSKNFSISRFGSFLINGRPCGQKRNAGSAASISTICLSSSGRFFIPAFIAALQATV